MNQYCCTRAAVVLMDEQTEPNGFLSFAPWKFLCHVYLRKQLSLYFSFPPVRLISQISINIKCIVITTNKHIHLHTDNKIHVK